MHNELSAWQWKAIEACDADYDGQFLYGVITTRIFCRPSCRSRLPLKSNVVVFHDASQALSLQFRPCKRCKPDELEPPAEEWIGRIVEWIDQHYAEPITLQKLADMAHGSPYHLQRQFKRIKGHSPAEYVQTVRLKAAMRSLLSSPQSAAEIARTVGFSSVPHFNSLFKRKLGVTPASFRIRHTFHDNRNGGNHE